MMDAVDERDQDPRYEWIELRTFGDPQPHYMRGPCRHIDVVPVESGGEVVAHLCLDLRHATPRGVADMSVATRTRADIEAEIAKAKRKYDRMPAHWEARRIGLMRQIEALVDEWIAAGDGEGTAPHA